MPYFMFYYLAADGKIMEAAQIPFPNSAYAKAHAEKSLARYQGVEVWSAGVLMYLTSQAPSRWAA